MYKVFTTFLGKESLRDMQIKKIHEGKFWSTILLVQLYLDKNVILPDYTNWLHEQDYSECKQKNFLPLYYSVKFARSNNRQQSTPNLTVQLKHVVIVIISTNQHVFLPIYKYDKKINTKHIILYNTYEVCFS